MEAMRERLVSQLKVWNASALSSGGVGLIDGCAALQARFGDLQVHVNGLAAGAPRLPNTLNFSILSCGRRAAAQAGLPPVKL
jgi:hypothetical protein